MFRKRKEQAALQAAKQKRLEDELEWVQSELIKARTGENLNRYGELIDLQFRIEQTLAYTKGSTVSEQMEKCLADMEQARLKEDFKTYQILSDSLFKLSQTQAAQGNNHGWLIEIGGNLLCTIAGGMLQNRLVGRIVNAEKEHVFRTQAWSFIPTKLPGKFGK